MAKYRMKAYTKPCQLYPGQFQAWCAVFRVAESGRMFNVYDIQLSTWCGRAAALAEASKFGRSWIQRHAEV